MTRPRRDTANIDRPGATRRFDLIERDTELELLEAAFERATTGRGSVVLVAGEPGIGKTSLIRAFAEELGDRARMFFGSCEDLLAPRTLGPFRDMLRDAVVETPDLRDRADRHSYIDIWHDLMTFEMRPAVVAIDDAHWADDGTLDLIRYFGRRIERMPTVLIVTYRPSPGRGKLARILGALVGPETGRIALHGLSDQAVTTIALAAGADPASVVPVAGGNPFYLSEILASPNTSVPVAVRDAVTTRLLTLPDDTRLVLEVSSVAPEGADHAMLEAVAGVDAAAAVAAEMAGFIAVQPHARPHRPRTHQHDGRPHPSLPASVCVAGPATSQIACVFNAPTSPSGEAVVIDRTPPNRWQAPPSSAGQAVAALVLETRSTRATFVPPDLGFHLPG